MSVDQRHQNHLNSSQSTRTAPSKLERIDDPDIELAISIKGPEVTDPSFRLGVSQAGTEQPYIK